MQFSIYVRWLFGWRSISSLHSADESQIGRNSCDPALSVLVMLLSRNVFHVVSALQSIVFNLSTSRKEQDPGNDVMTILSRSEI